MILIKNVTVPPSDIGSQLTVVIPPYAKCSPPIGRGLGYSTLHNDLWQRRINIEQEFVMWIPWV